MSADRQRPDSQPTDDATVSVAAMPEAEPGVATVAGARVGANLDDALGFEPLAAQPTTRRPTSRPLPRRPGQSPRQAPGGTGPSIIIDEPPLDVDSTLAPAPPEPEPEVTRLGPLPTAAAREDRSDNTVTDHRGEGLAQRIEVARAEEERRRASDAVARAEAQAAERAARPAGAPARRGALRPDGERPVAPVTETSRRAVAEPTTTIGAAGEQGAVARAELGRVQVRSSRLKRRDPPGDAADAAQPEAPGARPPSAPRTTADGGASRDKTDPSGLPALLEDAQREATAVRGAASPAPDAGRRRPTDPATTLPPLDAAVRVDTQRLATLPAMPLMAADDAPAGAEESAASALAAARYAAASGPALPGRAARPKGPPEAGDSAPRGAPRGPVEAPPSGLVRRSPEGRVARRSGARISVPSAPPPATPIAPRGLPIEPRGRPVEQRAAVAGTERALRAGAALRAPDAALAPAAPREGRERTVTATADVPVPVAVGASRGGLLRGVSWLAMLLLFEAVALPSVDGPPWELLKNPGDVTFVALAFLLLCVVAHVLPVTLRARAFVATGVGLLMVVFGLVVGAQAVRADAFDGQPAVVALFSAHGGALGVVYLAAVALPFGLFWRALAPDALGPRIAVGVGFSWVVLAFVGTAVLGLTDGPAITDALTTARTSPFLGDRIVAASSLTPAIVAILGLAAVARRVTPSFATTMGVLFWLLLAIPLVVAALFVAKSEAWILVLQPVKVATFLVVPLIYLPAALATAVSTPSDG